MNGRINKLRGGYYTPNNVAQFICEWAITSPSATVFEPSCGDGAFIEAANQRLSKLGAVDAGNQILGVELFSKEAEKARAKGGRVICSDFFTYCKSSDCAQHFDAIVGNPPFIRYQDFGEEYRKIAFDLMKGYGLSPNRLTNIWLPFLIVCCHLLNDGGRLGMVIPAELFQVNYAAETREFLTSYFSNITVITFTELLFDGAQQEVILLLAERADNGDQGVRVVEETNAETLLQLSASQLALLPFKHRLPNAMKWQAYYLNSRALDLIAELVNHADVHASSELFDVNVGIVSGQNSFFIVDRDTARDKGIEESCVPIISRSLQLDGIVLRDEDFNRQIDLQRKVLLFLPGDVLSESDRDYVASGESAGYNKNFKCRIRKPWYKVPTSWVPDAFFYRQVGAYPRIVINEKGTYVTDTLHKIRFTGNVDGRAVAVAFNNSLTFVASELMGRSYGGGVLTFEPSEARGLPIPFKRSYRFDFEKADSLARRGKIEQLMDYVDEITLINGIGLTREEVSLLRESWLTLRNRRLMRKKR